MKYYSLKTRMMALLLCAVMVLGMVPTHTVAVTEQQTLGTVETITEGTSQVTGSGTSNAAVQVEKTQLDWSAADPSINREIDAWWYGVKVTAPAGSDDTTLAGAAYQNRASSSAADDGWGSWGDKKSFLENKDGEYYITLWIPITGPELLEKYADLEKDIQSQYQFDWDGNGQWDQTVTVSIDPAGVTLKKDGVQTYPLGAVEAITGGNTEITGNLGSSVTVQVEKTQLDWAAADPSINREIDAWWYGVKVTAPAGSDDTTLAGAAYQNRASSSAADGGWGAWGDKKFFLENKDGEYYITLWVPITGPELLEKYADLEKDIQSQYQFDWDGNGQWDQTVTVSIAPEGTTLMKESVQQYPLGDVSAITGGTVAVNGNGKKETTVQVDAVTMDWSEKDASAGRTIDAWWYGIKVNAPVGSDDTTLAGAIYQNRASSSVATDGWGTWGAAKSFLENRDGEYYITLWVPITGPGLLKKYVELDRDIQSQYQFDWDGNGQWDQIVTISIDPAGVILNKKSQAPIYFEENSPGEWWVGNSETFQNTATGGSTELAIVYSVEEKYKGIADVDSEGNLTLTKKEVGEVVVTATCPGNDFYEPISASYSIQIVKIQQTPRYEKGNPTLIFGTDTDFTNPIIGAQGPVTWWIVNENGEQVKETDVASIDEMGEVTIKSAGTAKIRACIAGNIEYEAKDLEYTITVQRGEQTDFGFADTVETTVTWQKDVLEALALKNDPSTGALSWEVIASESLEQQPLEATAVASVADDGKITLNRSGRFTIQVKKAGDACYQDSETVSITIQVNKADQTDFAFAADSKDMTYNDEGNEFTMEATGGQVETKVIYELIEDQLNTGVITIDQEGKVTVNKAGQVTIKATRPGDDRYNAAEASYELTVEKDTQEFTFEHEAVALIYGTRSYVNPVTFEDHYSTKSAMTYTVSSNNIGAAIGNDGTVTFAASQDQVGAVTVTATKAGDECYKEASLSYTLTVSYLELGEGICPAPKGDPNTDNEPWYKSNMKIVAPDGYKISYSNSLDENNAWDASVPYDTNGAALSKVVYLKNDQGHITGEIQVDDLYYDAEVPANLKIEYSTPVLEKIISGLTFGFYEAEAVITVYADDAVSGIKAFKLSYTEDIESSGSHQDDFKVELSAEKVENTEATYSAAYTVEKADNLRGTFTFTAVDAAGNETPYAESAAAPEPVIVTDNKAPEVTVTYEAIENVSYENSQGVVVSTFDEAAQAYYNKGLNLGIEINEANFFEGRAAGEDGQEVLRNVLIEVTRVDDKGNTTVTEYMCAGAEAANTANAKETISWGGNGDIHTTSITLEETGDYTVRIRYQDYSKNNGTVTGNDGSTQDGDYLYTSKTLTVDTTAPVVGVVYGNEDVKYTDPETGREYFDKAQKATITVVEHNFDASLVEAEVEALDLLDASVQVENFNETLKKPASWSSVGDDTYEATIEFATDANYSFNVGLKDRAGYASETQKDLFTVDQTAPDVWITYDTSVFQKIISGLTFGFYEASTVITVHAQDDTTAVTGFELTYTKESSATDSHQEDFIETEDLEPVQVSGQKEFKAAYTLEEWGRGIFSLKATNMSTKVGQTDPVKKPEPVIVTDDTDPTITVTYTPDKDVLVSYIKDGKLVRDPEGELVHGIEGFKTADAAYFDGKVTVGIEINEANFFEGRAAGEDGQEILRNVLIEVTRVDDKGNTTVTEYMCAGAEAANTANAKETISWGGNGDIHTTSIELEKDGDYTVRIRYQDYSKNNGTVTGNDGSTQDGDYLYTSKTLTVDTTAPVVDVVYGNEDVKYTDPETGRKYFSEDPETTIQVTEHNFDAELVTLKLTEESTGRQEDLTAHAADSTKWVRDSENPDLYTLKLPFDPEKDGRYKLEVTVADRAQNSQNKQSLYVYDHTKPTDPVITYSEPVLGKLIEELTFGFYKADMEVSVTVEDVTAGVDYIMLKYIRQDGASDDQLATFPNEGVKLQVNWEEPNGYEVTLKYPITAEQAARGYFQAVAYDRAGLTSKTVDHSNIIVTDNVAPAIKVEYAPADSKTDVYFTNKGKDVESFAASDNAYYDGAVNATVQVTEANFFEGKLSGTDPIHELVLKVTHTDENGNAVTTEYVPWKNVGKNQAYVQWKKTQDKYEAVIPFAKDGDYVLTVQYTDFSQNHAEISDDDDKKIKKTYTSKTITVDTVAPVVNVTYGNREVVNTVDGRQYFADTQTATIQITEHNFRSADVVAMVTAKDFVGTDVPVADFAAQLKKPASWTKDGNVYTAKISWPVNANYTFDLDYADLSRNASADRSVDLFTVDTTAPTDLAVTYSTSVLDRILESVTFGYYNATMTVTISAADVTTGIHHFAYSYINSQGVSSVNAELINEAIAAAAITHDGYVGTATFQIPKMVLGSDNQFNGTVSFTAFDRSENNTLMEDTRRVIVDNITPTSTITYNVPVQNVNNISYYAGNIDGTIAINEANFDSADVQVVIHREGAEYPVNVSWSDQDVDHHTGRFTLTEDGDYTVTVNYTDKSGNRMNEYTSNTLTLDKTLPAIHVSNIVAESANKDETYGFVITMEDTNLDAGVLEPVLEAVVRDAEGNFKTTQIDLGEAVTVVQGKTYTFTVEDLPQDALYTLRCQAKDMSGNAISQFTLDDGKTYEEVQFSINREGSTFGFENAFTSDLMEQYYVYSVNEDVVLFEINVDPIEDYSLTLNGKELTEGTDYTTQQTSEPGKWSKRIYTVSKELFTAEGEYSVVVFSKDKAQSDAFSDVKGASVAFVVDQTPPVVTITGLKTKGRYQTEIQQVILQPTDDGGLLNTLIVRLVNDDGDTIKELVNLAGEELLTYLEENDGKVTFEIGQGLYQNVRIICTDHAVGENLETNIYDEAFEEVSVSTSGFMIFWANKPVRWSVIAGIILLIAAIVVFIVLKKKKKKENKEKK